MNKLKLNLQSQSYQQLQLVREQFLSELEHSLRSMPSVTEAVSAINKFDYQDPLVVNFQDRLDALCTLLKERYQFEGMLELSDEESFAGHTDEMSDEDEMVKEHGIFYNWIITCHYKPYTEFSVNKFKSIEQILSFWTQHDFTDAFDDYGGVSEHIEVVIRIHKLKRISVSHMSIQDWTL